MNKDVTKILTELEENDNEVLDLIEKLTQSLATTNKKIDILWSCQFGKGSKLADDDVIFPTINGDYDDADYPCRNQELPLPVKRFKDKKSGNMVDVCSSSVRSQLEKIGEELLEATVESVKFLEENEPEYMAFELVDTIVACLTLLEKIGYGSYKRSVLYRDINNKNRKRGYLD